ncbi:mCG140300, partial [Mus musculus]
LPRRASGARKACKSLLPLAGFVRRTACGSRLKIFRTESKEAFRKSVLDRSLGAQHLLCLRMTFSAFEHSPFYVRLCDLLHLVFLE